MIKELGSMALVAVLTTNISNHFGTAMAAAQDIAGIYKSAAIATSPEQFIALTQSRVQHLSGVADQVAKLNLKQEIGPFGVMIASK